MTPRRCGTPSQRFCLVLPIALFLGSSTAQLAHAQECDRCVDPHRATATQPATTQPSADWRRALMPALFTANLNALKELCADFKIRYPGRAFMLLAAKSHACDKGSKDCLRSVRDLSDPANSWLQSNFGTYHLVGTYQERSTIKFVAPGDFGTGWGKFVSEEGTDLIVDPNTCEVLGSVDDGRRTNPRALRRERLEGLNQRIADLLKSKGRTIPALKVVDIDRVPELDLDALEKADEHQFELHVLSKLPPRKSSDLADRNALFKFLGEHSPLSWSDLVSLRQRMTKEQRPKNKLFTAGAESLRAGTIDSAALPPCLGFEAVWEARGQGNTPEQRRSSGLGQWRRDLERGLSVEWPAGSACPE